MCSFKSPDLHSPCERGRANAQKNSSFNEPQLRCCTHLRLGGVRSALKLDGAVRVGGLQLRVDVHVPLLLQVDLRHALSLQVEVLLLQPPAAASANTTDRVTMTVNATIGQGKARVHVSGVTTEEICDSGFRPLV